MTPYRTTKTLARAALMTDGATLLEFPSDLDGGTPVFGETVAAALKSPECVCTDFGAGGIVVKPHRASPRRFVIRGAK